MHTVGDLAAFSVRQEAALASCDARRLAVVAAVDAQNALATDALAGAKPRRWRLFGGGR